MNEEIKTIEHLTSELKQLRQRTIELEKLEVESKQVEQELKNSEQFSKDVFDSIQDGISILDPNLNIIRTNQWMEKMYADQMPLTGKKCYQVYQRRNSICPWCPSRKTLEDGKLHTEIVPYPDADNPTGWIELSAYPFLDNAGKMNGVIEHVKDISVRKQAEEKNEHLNLVLRAIRNVNQLITKEKNRDKLLKGACENLIENRGYFNAWIALFDDSGKYLTSAEAGLGENISPIIEIMKKGKLTTCGKKALKKTDVIVTDNPAETCKDCPLAGHYADRGAMTIRLEYDGKIYGLASVIIPNKFTKNEEEHNLFQEVTNDISFALFSIEIEKKRKQAEKKLQEREQNFRDLVENLMDGVAIADENAYHIYVNPKFSEITGYSRDELLNMTGWDFTRPQDRAELQQRMKDCMAGKPIQTHYERIIVRKDGIEVPVEISTTTTIWQGKKRPMAIIHDISERRKAEEELRKLKDKLEIKVAEQTEELQEKVSELQHFHDATIDREFRMKELRDEIDELKKKLEEE